MDTLCTWMSKDLHFLEEEPCPSERRSIFQNHNLELLKLFSSMSSFPYVIGILSFTCIDDVFSTLCLRFFARTSSKKTRHALPNMAQINNNDDVVRFFSKKSSFNWNLLELIALQIERSIHIENWKCSTHNTSIQMHIANMCAIVDICTLFLNWKILQLVTLSINIYGINYFEGQYLFDCEW